MLNVNLCGLPLKNPILTAAGTFGFGKEFTPYMDTNKLGGIITKGLTLYPCSGAEGRRLWETPSGLVSNTGLDNPGLSAFIESELPLLPKINQVVIPNLSGFTLGEIVAGARLLNDTPLPMVELNLSSPNRENHFIPFGQDIAQAVKLVKEVKKVLKQPLMVKLAPEAPNIVGMGVALQEAGADALSLINGYPATIIDHRRKVPLFTGGRPTLSGPAIFPIALQMVFAVCQVVHIPVVGCGGISSGEDVAQFIMAGATAVQIGTANFTRPNRSLEILDEFSAFLERSKSPSVDSLRGVAQPQ